MPQKSMPPGPCLSWSNNNKPGGFNDLFEPVCAQENTGASGQEGTLRPPLIATAALVVRELALVSGSM